MAYNQLKENGFVGDIVHLDNKVSCKLESRIKANNLEYQFVPTYNHRANPAEQAINTFKAYFKAAPVTCDQFFPTY